MGTTRIGHTDAMGEPSTSTRPVLIRVTTGAERGQETHLTHGTLAIGSSPDAELRLTDPTVSRFHAELALVPQGLRVKDLGSTNGTFLLGSRIELAIVQPGTEIKLGRVCLEILAPELPLPQLPADADRFGRLVGDALPMRRAFALLDRAASVMTPVWLHGETGTGKTAAAQALHAACRRAEGPYRVIDLAAAPSSDALRNAFESASGGTLVLEQADAATTAVQTALLTHLAEHEQTPGSARLVTTSIDDPRSATERGVLRRNLLFHLGAARIELPPLRDRLEDLPRLVEAIAGELGHASVRPTQGELATLRSQPFPGNVRELRRLIEGVLLSTRAPRASDGVLPAIDDSAIERLPFKDAKDKLLDAFERHYIELLLDRADGNLSKAAETAGLDRNHLTRLAKKHGLR